MAKAEPLDNAARRLHALLESYLANFDGRATSGNSAVWSAVLGVQGKGEFLAAFGRAFALIAEVRDAVEHLDDPYAREAYQLHANAWRTAFFPESFGWGQGLTGKAQLSRAAMVALAQIGNQLGAERVSSAKELPPEAIEELLGDAMELAEAAGDLPDELTSMLMQRLNDAIWALRHYRVTGSVGLEEALDRLAVAIVRTHQAAPEEVRKWSQGVAGFTKKAYGAIAIPGTLYGTYGALTALMSNLPGIGS